MAFCGNCGAQMEASERFCVKCGKDNGARTAAAPVATPVAVPPPVAPTPPVAPAPGMYAVPPGTIPVAVGVPPQVPAKKNNTLGTIIVLALLAGGGYYYYTHHSPPAPAPKPGSSNSDLAKQQDFEASWQNVNGAIQVFNGSWKNNATVSVQTATLECDQLDGSGNTLDEMRTTLNGPVAAGATATFNPFSMGAVAANLNKVHCYVVHVKQTAQQQ